MPMMDGLMQQRPTTVAILAIVAVIMLIETIRSRRNEAALRARGALEPAGDVYPLMLVAYPGCFVLIAAEGLYRGVASSAWLAAGVAVFGAAKLMKFWAIGTLGDRWTFRVLVLPGAPLITGGPYRYVRHPNYLAVLGELAGLAMMMAAPVTGMVAIVGFAVLLVRRIQIEERALGIR